MDEEGGYTTLEELENLENASVISEEEKIVQKKKKKKVKFQEPIEQSSSNGYSIYINTFLVFIFLTINSNPKVIRYIFNGVYEVIPYYYLSGAVSIVLTFIYYLLNKFLL